MISSILYLSVAFWSIFLLISFGLQEVEPDSTTRGCVGINADEMCPQTCRCTANASVIDCSFRKMKRVPDKLPINVTVLSLSDNLIDHLDNNTFRNCFAVVHLDLSNNTISHLPSEIFTDMGSSLKSLFLHHNFLYLDENSSALDSISNSLELLFIHNNFNVSETVFRNLISLRTLKIDGTITGGFGKSFSTLTSLTELQVYPSLTTIREHTFKHLRNLTSLNLADVGITFIHKNSFKPLKKLRHLNLAYNYKLNLLDVAMTFDGLSETIENLDLSFLIGNSKPTPGLTEDFFGKLRNKMHLTQLKLNDNQLQYIDIGFLSATKHLENIEISYNHLSNVFLLTTFMFQMVNLTRINANYQTLRKPEMHHDDNEIQQMKFFETRKLFSQKRKIKKDYSMINCYAKSVIKCRFPKSISKLRNYSWCLTTPKNLRSFLNAGSLNENIHVVPGVLFLGDFRLSSFYYRSNGLVTATGPIVVNRPMNDKPIIINVGDNNINCFAPNIFELSIKNGLLIGEIILDGNDLSDQLSQDLEGETFALYKDLTLLNLENNKLKTLHRDTFSSLHNLEVLILSRNSLQTIKFDLLPLKRLRILDLTFNLFVKLQDSSLPSLFPTSLHTNNADLMLYVDGNPFQCTCDSIKFLKWLIKVKRHIYDFDQIVCLNDESKRVSLKNADVVIKGLMMSCYYELMLEILGGLAALIIVCTFIGVVIYRHRWDIRYYFLKLSQKRKEYHIWKEKTSFYKYDAFVAYDHNDSWWIVQELIVNLERLNFKKEKQTGRSNKNKRSMLGRQSDNPYEKLVPTASFGETQGTAETTASSSGAEFVQNGLRFCIHERDFDVGKNIESSIMNAIEQSRKVILVISKNFVKSDWCLLELEMAKMVSLCRGINVVVTIFLEPLKDKMESLEWLIKRYTYLEWYQYNDDSTHQEFWKRMKTALSDSSSEKIVCDCGREFFNR